MILFKIFQKILLSSNFFGVLILSGLILLFRGKREKRGRLLILVGLVSYYFFSISPFVDLVLAPLENQFEIITEEQLSQAEKIVFLTGGGESDILRSSEALRLYFKRLKLRGERTKIIVSGTDALEPEKTEETEDLKNYLLEMGVLSDDIILELNSRTTFESGENIKKILIPNEQFFLVTSAYHLPRAMEVFKKMEMNPIPAPTDFKRKKSYNLFDLLPNGGNLEKSNSAFHEYFGLLFYKIKLWLAMKTNQI